MYHKYKYYIPDVYYDNIFHVLYDILHNRKIRNKFDKNSKKNYEKN